MSLCASVYMCFVVTCWERADLLALVCGVYCEFVTFPLVSWVRCGTWLYRFLIFAPLLTFKIKKLPFWSNLRLLETNLLIIRYQQKLIPPPPPPKKKLLIYCVLWWFLSSVKIFFWYLLVPYINSPVTGLKFAPFSYFQPILAAIFVTIATVKVKSMTYFYTLAIVLIN